MGNRQSIFTRVRRRLNQLSDPSPRMIYHVELNGQHIPDTRIGSTTAIVGRRSLTIEENVFIGQFNFIEATHGMTIGEGCQITNYVSLLSHSSHRSIRLYGRSYKQAADPIGYIKGPVVIGAYTFVGPHVTVMPNTTVGKGAIVSAYSFVRGPVPDFAIVAGNPAEVVGDTRDLDARYLEEHAELLAAYEEWTGRT